MLPLTLLRTGAHEHTPLLIELKSGETYNGQLVSTDTYMNVNLQNVICTSADGSQFWKIKHCYIRGSAIKYLRIPDALWPKAQQQEETEAQQRQAARAGRGGRQGRGGRSNSRTPRGGRHNRA